MSVSRLTDLQVPRTSLHRPRRAASLVDRPRLLARLDRGVDLKLTLVCAPAGYGKSTLLGSWLEDGARRVTWRGAWRAAWLTLDEHDRDPSRFVRALVAAIQTAVPDAGRSTLALLSLPEPPSPSDLASALADELTTLPNPLILVLDDYQWIDAVSVHELLSALLLRLPDPLHMVISSRSRPPLPLATLRAAGQLDELRADDLRFNHNEARMLLDLVVGEGLPERTVTILEERTEGWPAGLRLAAILLRDRPDHTATLATFEEGSHEHVREYLLQEVLARQPADVRRLLIETSILDRFCAALCGTVVGWASAVDCGEILDRAVQGGVMLVPLDERGEWFRYHRLFQEMLQRQLLEEAGPETVARLHQRAADWLAERAMTVDAVRHLLAADDVDGAARLVERSIHPALNREGWPDVVEWLDALPSQVVSERPALLLARAWVLYFRDRALALPSILEIAEAVLQGEPPAEDIDSPLRGELDTLWSAIWLRRGDANAALACARRALERLGNDQWYARGVAAGSLGVALQRSGRGAQALKLAQAQTDRETGATAVYTARLLLTMGYCHLADGRLDRFENGAWEILALARAHDLPLTSAWAHYGLGRVLYEWNDLQQAVEQFTLVIEHRHEARYDAYRDSVLGLSLTYQALGQPELARETLRPLLRIMREAGTPAQLTILRSFEARLALLQGESTTWSRWADTSADDAVDGTPDVPEALESARITRAWTQLAQGDPASLTRASEVLAALEHLYTAQYDRPRLIQILALQALVRQARGEREAGLALLERAIAHGRPGGFIRTFVDLGPPMARMMAALPARGRSSHYVDRILAAFPPTPEHGDQLSSSDESGPDLPTGEIESLTWREQDVLRLLGRRLANKEIAQALQISPLTVKKHAENIYRKLQADGRRTAIERARALGLVSDR